jgi:UDP-N-acetylmuramoyl-tripeptide--D-alanyl-D-alanine ligase
MITLVDCVEFLTRAPGTAATVQPGQTAARPPRLGREHLVPEHRVEGEAGIAFTDVVIDSRDVRPDSLFVALPGTQTDGHQFVQDALARGAAGALVQHAIPLNPRPAVIDVRQNYDATLLVSLRGPVFIRVDDTLAALQRLAQGWRARFPVRVIGVTGSIGKTTTKETVAAVMTQRYDTLISEANLNNEIGLPLTLLRLRPRHECAVLEMGMYARGEIAALAEIARPRVGIVTNVGPSHLERLGSLEAIAAAKAELVEALPPDGTAVLNADDPRVAAMAERTAANVFTYGVNGPRPQAAPSDRQRRDLWADEIESMGLDGISFRLHHGPDTLHVKVPMLGRHSVHNALAAAAAGLVEGLSWQDILEGLQEPRGQLRLVVVPGINGATVLDDTYNASPDSTLAALNLMADLNGRKIGVLGDMLELGDYEQEGHAKVGVRAAAVLDKLIAVGALGGIIGEAALEAGMAPDDVVLVMDKGAAIEHLRTWLQPDDTVLVKGSRALHLEDVVTAITV